jgi:hypothetical protein
VVHAGLVPRKPPGFTAAMNISLMSLPMNAALQQHVQRHMRERIVK